MKSYRITGTIKRTVYFDKTVVALNKADAFNTVKNELYKINRLLEIKIEEDKNGYLPQL